MTAETPTRVSPRRRRQLHRYNGRVVRLPHLRYGPPSSRSCSSPTRHRLPASCCRSRPSASGSSPDRSAASSSATSATDSILLTLLRLPQVFSVGGEWGGATLMAVEHASTERKGFWLFVAALVLVFGLAMAPAAGVTGALFSLVFDADVRYSGVSIGYTLSQVAGSAFAPTIAAALYDATKSSDAIVCYLIAASVVSAVSVCLLPGPWRQPTT